MKKRRLATGLLVCFAAGFLLLVYIHVYINRPVVLQVGFWAGSYWGVPTSDSYAVLDAAISKFERQHPNTQVEYTTGLLERDYTEWLMAKMLTGNAPDVMLIPPEDFDTIAAVGGLEPCDMDALQERKFYPATLISGQWEGKQYTLPYECVPTLMFVNKTLLEQENIAVPGDDWTWADFYEICQQVTRDTNGDGTVDQFGCCNYTWEEAFFTSQENASLFQNGGKVCNLTSPEMVDTLSFVLRLNALAGEHIVTEKEFESGAVAFRPMLFSEYRAYQSYPWRIKKYSRFEWDCLKMPSENESSAGNISELVTLQMGVSSQSKHKDLAWELLKTLTCDEEIQEKIYTDSQGCSPLSTVTVSPKTEQILRAYTLSDGSINLSMLDEILQTAVTVPRFKNYRQVMALVNTRISEAMADADNLELNLATAQMEINHILES